MMGMHAWLVSWLTKPSMHTQHQRHRLIQNKRVFEVLFYKTHRILLVSRKNPKNPWNPLLKDYLYEDKHTCMDGCGDVGSNHNKSPKANLGDFC